MALIPLALSQATALVIPLLLAGVGLLIVLRVAERPWARILGSGLVGFGVVQAVLVVRWHDDSCWDVGDPCGDFGDVVVVGQIVAAVILVGAGVVWLMGAGPFGRSDSGSRRRHR